MLSIARTPTGPLRRHLLRLCAALLAGLATLVIASCGGGASTAQNNNGNGGIGSGGTGSYTNGPISGLGSIIVNGIEYSVSDGMTTVIGDDDSSTSSGVAALLKIGMVVEVTGSATTASTVRGQPDTATATAVRYGSALVGQVSAVGALDTTTQRPASITVLGQTVTIDSKTSFIDSAGHVIAASAISNNSYVEVHGLVNSSNALTATLIQTLASQPAAYKIKGTVISRPSASSFTLGQSGNVTVTYGGSVSLPNGVGVGSVVKVWVSNSPVSSGSTFTAAATRIKVQGSSVSDSAEARLNGEIDKVSASGHRIRVNGVTVDTSRAVVSGSVNTESALAEDQRVDVTGAMSGGVLVAKQIVVLSQTELDDEDVELTGVISSLSPSATTFVLRGVTVNYSGIASSGIDNGPLFDGACVETQGKSYNAAGQLIATEIEVESSSECH